MDSNNILKPPAVRTVSNDAGRSESQRPSVREAIRSKESIKCSLGNRAIGSDGDCCLLVAAGFRLATYSSRNNIDAVPTKLSTDRPKHAWLIAVADQGEMTLKLKVEPLAPGFE